MQIPHHFFLYEVKLFQEMTFFIIHQTKAITRRLQSSHLAFPYCYSLTRELKKNGCTAVVHPLIV